MTTLTVPTTGAVSQLRRVLQIDAVVTGAVGLFGLLGPAWYAGPSWVARAVGLVLVVVAVEVGLMSRSARVALVGKVTAELAFAWVVGAVLAAVFLDMETSGREVLLATAVVTLAFGVTETRLVRALASGG
jgi:hypothetical protein